MKFIPFFLALVFAGCFSEGDCLISATNNVRIQFKKIISKTDTAIAFTGITVSGSDSVAGFKTSVTQLVLPVDIHHSTTTFIFHRINPADSSITATDTLTVGYTQQTKVITRDCGAYTYYQNLKVIKTSLPSAQLKSLSTSLLKDPTSSGITAYAVNYQLYY